MANSNESKKPAVNIFRLSDGELLCPWCFMGTAHSADTKKELAETGDTCGVCYRVFDENSRRWVD